ncbi:ATP phosphoribosyltransferase [Amorphus orientalis]|uniref:ATP phosphoribosyltransferase n=1 Tax=Amorphus orientalis TaxID=649198 RepID=A0AAE3VNI0_9HYPH|nr:ATP phosphoribosyltransferase [Amorphus orientalis]MDQ0315230.1 ATP phosphoribosyltransferase [Amorphus orientalis]
MSSLVIAIPSKGRLEENVSAFFDRAGLKIRRAAGSRRYRAGISGVENAEIAFLSASEIAREVTSGNVHFGVTGLDLIHETVSDATERTEAVHLVTPLGFGQADVVVAVPQVWIDVETIDDLAEVAEDFRARHGRSMRVATKYVNLARRHFAEAGIVDYRIVESLGATEGAPAAGTAEIIVDITTTGSTLAANALKVLDGGLILCSEAHLLAARTADWTEEARAAATTVLDRIAAELRARSVREIRAVVSDPLRTGAEAANLFGTVAPFGSIPSPMTLHCPAEQAYRCAQWLKAQGAETVTISRVDDVFEPNNALLSAFEAAIGPARV